jgi:hypothetical protein
MAKIARYGVVLMVVPVMALGTASPAAAGRSPVTTPTGFQAEVEASSVIVTWQPSTSRAGEVSIYFVKLDGRTSWTVEPTMTFFLAQNRTFRVEVQAQDSEFNRSNWSQPFEFTTPDEFPVTTPGNVRVADSPGSATVEWDAASSAAGVLDYLVTLRGSEPTSRRTTGTSVTFDRPGGGDFEVTVQARDGAYRLSDISDPVAFTVDPVAGFEPPTAPTNLRASFDSLGRVQSVAWDGSEGTGPFTYILQIEDSGEIERTTQLEMELLGFVQCTETTRQTMVFFVTALANGLESPASEPILLCFK